MHCMRIEGRLETHPRGNRRHAQRRELHLRLTSIAGKGATANVVVLDLSQSGLLLQSPVRLAVGETLQINLPQAGFKVAEVVWTSGEFAGCRFEEPLSGATVSAARLRSEPSSATESVSRAALASRSAEDATLGRRLRRLRQQYNLSQATLAKLLGVSKLSIWKWERDEVRPRRASIEALAKLFAVTERELLLGAPSREDNPGVQAQPVGQEAGALVELVGQCKARIAGRLGVAADKVNISITL